MPSMPPKPKAKGKPRRQAKPKNKPPASTPGKSFPLEKGLTPSKMEPKDITRLYKLPDGKLKTENDVIEANGYALEEKVSALRALWK